MKVSCVPDGCGTGSVLVNVSKD